MCMCYSHLVMTCNDILCTEGKGGGVDLITTISCGGRHPWCKATTHPCQAATREETRVPPRYPFPYRLISGYPHPFRCLLLAGIGLAGDPRSWPAAWQSRRRLQPLPAQLDPSDRKCACMRSCDVRINGTMIVFIDSHKPHQCSTGTQATGSCAMLFMLGPMHTKLPVKGFV